jgi:gamma-glutamyl-gamma-aminobutyrate hydrolase PuuD
MGKPREFTVVVVGADPRVLQLFREKMNPKTVSVVGKMPTNGEATIVVWTGGADIAPALYGQSPMEGIKWDEERDFREEEMWEAVGENKDILKIGICRGAQFLHAMNGGSLFQDVDNHTNGTHPAYDMVSKSVIEVTSTHHQQLKDTFGGELLAFANVSRVKRSAKTAWSSDAFQDIEVLWHSKTSCMCFQPHPEYSHKPTEDLFWRVLEEKAPPIKTMYRGAE